MAKGKYRDKRLEVYWRRIIRERTRSGLTIRGFCGKSKVPESAFYFWRRELERRQGQRRECQQEQRDQTPAPAAFVPVRVTDEVRLEVGGRIEIVLANGQRVHVVAPVDRRALGDVLAVLEGRPC
jgi:transposase-like protein